MADWREHILREFTPEVGKATLVADPNRLLTEPGLSEALNARGFELLLFEDPVAFRFAYESKYRYRLDAGQLVDLVVLQHGDSSSLRCLPFDLLARSRRLAFSLAGYFPNLSVSGALCAGAAVSGPPLRCAGEIQPRCAGGECNQGLHSPPRFRDRGRIDQNRLRSAPYSTP